MSVEAILLVFCFLAMLMLNVPVAFAIGLATFISFLSTGRAVTQVSSDMASGVESFALLAIPFFILAGNLMGEGGMATRLMNFANALVGWIRGGLSFVNVITCMLFGAISGSAAAAISSIGGFMIPEMEKKGYDKDFSIAITSTAATTGLLIPPSNVMIVYSVVAEGASVAAIFMAGVFPGILVGLLIMSVCAVASIKSKYGSGDWRMLKRLYVEGLWALPSLVLIVIVLGGILYGVFTATEAAAVAVLYAFFVPAAHWVFEQIFARLRGDRKTIHMLVTDATSRSLKWLQKMPEILLKSGKTTGIVMLLIATSQSMSWFLTYEQIPQQVSQALLSMTDNRILIFLLINVILLCVGTFLDMTPAVLIFTPIFLPVVTRLGMDPTHFGVVMIANLCIGLCTPPVGTCLFLGCSVGGSTISNVTKHMLPFYFVMILALLVITFYSPVSMWLPGVMGLL